MIGLILMMIGTFLIVDDIFIHIMGDLSWADMGSPLHHWMLGVVLLAIGTVLFLKETKMMRRH